MQVVRTSFGFASLQKPPAEVYRKVLIAGLGRSGTSSIASVLRNAGFYLGEVERTATREDPQLREMLANGQGAGIPAILDEWAGKHELIAWKDPKLVGNEGRKLVHSLPADWAVVVIFRDPLATTWRLVSQHGGDLVERLTATVRVQKKLLKLVDETRKTLLLVSYEKLMSQPERACRELLGFLLPDRAAGIDIASVWSRTLADQKFYRAEAAQERAKAGISGEESVVTAEQSAAERAKRKVEGKRKPAKKPKGKRALK